jgi:nitrogen fixation/metabolism regulation signal transduction histidine kinase
MPVGRRLRGVLLTLLLLSGVLLWLSALLLFSRVAENSDDFARLQNWILLVNSIGVAVLVFMIAVNLVRLIRDLRGHVPGSRLKLRMITLLVALAVTPLVVVYLFSVGFINRGIDNWFSVDVEQGLDNALTLSQTALDLEKRRSLDELERIAARLPVGSAGELVSQLGQFRRDSGARELTIFGANNKIIATSSDDPDATVPVGPTGEVNFQLRQGRPYVSLEPLPDGKYEVIAAIGIGAAATRDMRTLEARFAVEPRLGALANSVQNSYNQYSELAFLRTALKYSFTLTLSLVLLIALLASVYGAFASVRRLVGPIQQLMQGTRAVARGDFDTRLPIPARDEIGFLINSFNDMTQRLAEARQEARHSEQKVESERKKLEVILTRLSTGVVSLEPDMRIRTANAAAGVILNVDLEARIGESLLDLGLTHPLVAQFLAVSGAHLERGRSDWREQIVLRGDVGRRVLMCACTALPGGENGSLGGYVVVFDDITALLQAQRDAAWGEVARRLAHEIKNPLTPIQLSAERLRRRYLVSPGDELDLLDRATHTIIEQVEAMKEMVNAFSQYARTPDVDLSRFDLNELISGVAELYRSGDHPVTITLSADANLSSIEADAGRMRQVFHNLMRNALDAMEQQADARVDIVTRHLHRDSGDAVEIKVCDNGPGFVDAIMDQAFEPYVTSKAKGTGLGLAIVKKLIEEHGGHITARNREQGGAEISILLPISGDVGGPLAAQPNEHRRERA